VKSTTMLVVAAMTAAGLGCSGAEKPLAPPEATPTEVAPESSTILERPFTAEQIRDAWIEGLAIRIHRWTPEAEAYELWTVVAADQDGVDIDAVNVDGDGTALGEAHVQHSTWVQLRDHATFPADSGRRDAVTRDTPLGRLDGWLYTVQDPSSDLSTEYFFAASLPGAPVSVRVLRDGELVELFEQIERSSPG